MVFSRIVLWCTALVALALPVTAAAQGAVQVNSAVFVERQDDRSRTLEPAHLLSRGDRVVTVMTWKRDAGNGAFTLTNALPAHVYYQGSARDDEEVSIDGGRTWGRIGVLKIGNRFATAEDVTHVRWRIFESAASGRIAYSAIVR